MIFFQILGSVILPIFLIVGAGWLLDRVFRLDLPTLSKLNFYIFVPALMFVMLLDDRIDARTVGVVSVFTLLHLLLLFGLTWAVGALPALRPRRTVLTLGVALNNCGNFGIPLVGLAFVHWPVNPVAILTVIIMVQNLFTFTAGVWLMEREARGGAGVLRSMAKIPVVYVILLALLLNWRHWMPPAPVMHSIRLIGQGLIPIALLTLGVQLSRARLSKALGPVFTVTGLRLLFAPLLAVALLPLFHLDHAVAAILVTAAGFPVAVNLTILSAEYRQDEDLAAQSIFLSTLLSGATLAVLLALVR